MSKICEGDYGQFDKYFVNPHPVNEYFFRLFIEI
jgi:hypothetical protein